MNPLENMKLEDLTAKLAEFTTQDDMQAFIAGATIADLTDFAQSNGIDVSKATKKDDYVLEVLIAAAPVAGTVSEDAAENGDDSTDDEAPTTESAGATGEGGGDESTESPEAAVKPEYDTSLPRKYLSMDEAALVSEIRGWQSVPRLPDDHGLSVDELRDYLYLLDQCGERGIDPKLWPSYQNYTDFEF